MRNGAFILVRPKFLGNIGSVARVMKNFGFNDLRFVEPPRNYKDAESRKMAVAAFDVLKQSKVFPSLEKAIEDLDFVIGTTSGQQRAIPMRYLDEFVDLPFNADITSIGVIFGDETDGLRADELSLCHSVVTIRTNDEFPALNLAQAAGIVAYELARLTSPDPNKVDKSLQLIPPSVNEIEQLFEQFSIFLERLEFARPRNKEKVLNALRSFFNRAMPSKRENDILKGILSKLNQSLTESKGKKSNEKSNKNSNRE
jgi:TrmH family RNA methyltransferase